MPLFRRCLLLFLSLLLLGACSTPTATTVPTATLDSPPVQTPSNINPTGFYWPTGRMVDSGNWLADSCGNNNNYRTPNHYHIGVDIPAGFNDSVYAIADGKVIWISYNGWGSGNIGLLIEHKLLDGTPFLAVYGHITSTLRIDSPVIGGNPIGTIGRWPGGTHLHFGTRYDTSNKDPYGMMPCDEWDDRNGFEEPINWITTKQPGPFLSPATATTIATSTRTPPTPVPTPTPRPSPTIVTPAPESGRISGWRCYPSESMPPMTIYVRNIDTLATYSLHVTSVGGSGIFGGGEGDPGFSLSIPSGNYIVFSWTDAGSYTPDSLGGVYSCHADYMLGKKLRCNASQQNDHNPIVLSLKPGSEITDVNVCDYYTDQIPPIEIQGMSLIILPTLVPSSCLDDSDFVADVTIPDNTRIRAGEAFEKTWRLLNSGTCNWTTNYQIIFISGEQMNGPSQIGLNRTVLPGEMIDISIDLAAPGRPGTYRGQWQLATPSGELFGTQPYVQILVP